jgi:HK97 family phage portal protein
MIETGSAAAGSQLYHWGLSSLSGEIVSPASASQVAAVFCAIKILSETIGMISLDMYEKKGDQIRLIPKHPLQFRLHDEPNEDQTAIEWRGQMTAQMVLWGNGCSRKILRGQRLAALLPLQYQALQMRRDVKGNRYFRYYPTDGSSGPEDYPADEVLHLKTLSLGGSSLEGTSPINQVRNAFGLALALEKYASRFFANGAIPGGVIMHPETLGDEGIRNIRESWKKLYGGADNANEIAVLEEGVKYQQIGVDPEKSQASESRIFQVREISRVFRIPPHMLYESEQQSHNTIEQASIEFVTYTLMPWIVRWEQGLNRSLLTPEEKGSIFCGFNLQDLLKGDLQSRYQAYAVGRNWGWLTANDILRREHMNPRDDPEGDVYLQPMNMIGYGEDYQQLPITPPPGRPPGDPSISATPTSSTTPRGIKPPAPLPKPLPKPGKKAMEIYERSQDIARNAREVSKLIQEALEAA